VLGASGCVLRFGHAVSFNQGEGGSSACVDASTTARAAMIAAAATAVVERKARRVLLWELA